MAFVGSRRNARLRSARSYFSSEPVIGYAGYVGRANLGDEGLFQAIDAEVAPVDILSVYDPMPPELRLRNMVFRSGRVCDLAMLGGGTLIFHDGFARLLERYAAQGVPYVTFGSGVVDTAFRAEKQPGIDWQKSRERWRRLLSKAEAVSVRGPRSKQMLDELGIASEIIGDPALSICPQPRERASNGRRVAINVGAFGPMWGDTAQVRIAIRDAAIRLRELGWEIEIFAMHKADTAHARQLAEELDDIPLYREYWKVAPFLNWLSRFDLVVSQKLHGAVFAAGLGCPVLSLAYEPKCLDFMESMGVVENVVPTDNLNAETILSAFTRLDEERDAITKTLHDRSVEYQHRIRYFGKRVRTMALESYDRVSQGARSRQST